MSKFFNDLKESLEEVIAYKKGKLKLNAETCFVQERPKNSKLKILKIERKKRSLTKGGG